MEIEKFRAARKEMEEEILASVHAAITKFKIQTSLTPYRIDVELADITTIGERERTYLASKVRCEVRI